MARSYSTEDHGRMRSEWRIYKYPRMESEAQKLLHFLHHVKGWTVEKVRDLGIFEKPSLLVVDGNILLNEGINALWNLVIGATATNYGSANARIGVGDGTTPESADQTGLQGTNKAWKAMDAGYPDRPSSTQCRWQSTFGGDEANFSWQEITVVNAADDSGQNLNRKVQNLGTKTSGSTWIAQLIITLS
ncbi:MAG: hypothetical protein QXF58_05180 [Desulfurococcaceae archaeon]